MNTNEYKILLDGLVKASERVNTQIVQDDGDTCLLTSMYFPEKLSKNQITISSEGPIWMGLWLGFQVIIHDDGFAMIPNFLAEYISEKDGLDFIFEDKYVYNPF